MTAVVLLDFSLNDLRTECYRISLFWCIVPKTVIHFVFRSVGRTQMNEESSRSHCVFTLRIFGVNEVDFNAPVTLIGMLSFRI